MQTTFPVTVPGVGTFVARAASFLDEAVIARRQLGLVARIANEMPLVAEELTGEAEAEADTETPETNELSDTDKLRFFVHTNAKKVAVLDRLITERPAHLQGTMEELPWPVIDRIWEGYTTALAMFLSGFAPMENPTGGEEGAGS